MEIDGVIRDLRTRAADYEAATRRMRECAVVNQGAAQAMRRAADELESRLNAEALAAEAAGAEGPGDPPATLPEGSEPAAGGVRPLTYIRESEVEAEAG